MSDRNIPALIAYLHERAAAPFAWGREGNDCVSFAAGALQALTGSHRLDAGRDRLRWNSQASALRLLKKKGGLVALVDARFNRIAPSRAQRGDIAGIEDDELGVRLMIVEGSHLVGPGDAGLKRLPRTAMTIAWSAIAPKAADNG